MSSTKLGGIDLNLLVAFDALLTEVNVTRAAKRVGLSQPAMSHALNRLRSLFEDPLLVRTARGMVLTPRAQQLQTPLREALGRIETVLDKTETFDPATAQRRFTLAGLDYVEFVMLPPLLEYLSKHAPGIDLFVVALHQDVSPMLESGEVDLSLGVNRPAAPGIYQQKLFQERFVCLVRKDHPEVKRSLSLEQYVRLDHLLVAPQHQAHRGGYVDAALAQRGLRRRIALAVPHFLVAPLVVSRSNLVFTVPERIARAYTELLPLRSLPVPLELNGFSMMQHWHERNHRDPAHVWLRTVIADLAKEL